MVYKSKDFRQRQYILDNEPKYLYFDGDIKRISKVVIGDRIFNSSNGFFYNNNGNFISCDIIQEFLEQIRLPYCSRYYINSGKMGYKTFIEIVRNV